LIVNINEEINEKKTELSLKSFREKGIETIKKDVEKGCCGFKVKNSTNYCLV